MILERIKKETEKNHMLLESAPLLAQLSAPHITRDIYIEILNKFYGYFKPLEDALNPFSDAIADFLPDLRERRKAAWILSDLESLETASARNLCSDIPAMQNLSQAFGALYVMEGSTLGGRVISKMLSDALALGPANGAAFFNGYGPATGEKWKLFRQALTDYALWSKDDDTIIRGANTYFEKFHNWVNKRDG